MSTTSELIAGLKLIDSDTHYSEPYDLWTSRAPAAYRDRVPKVRKAPDGRMFWFLKDEPLFMAGGASFVNRAGEKVPFYGQDITTSESWERIHVASYDPHARLELMDEIGVHAHVVYPNTLGFSMGSLVQEADGDLAYATVAIYNDAVAEWAEQGKGRLLPQAVVPFWDIDLAVKEVQRIHDELHLTGVTMSGEPHTAGLPDLGDRAWDPFYELITELGLPINIHIGAQAVAGHMANFGQTAWPSLSERANKPVNSVQIELANSRFISNLVLSDVPIRWPEVKWVSVESGMGWIPYVLERVDYEFFEEYPSDPPPDRPSAFEIFRRCVYGTFWFENAGPTLLLDTLGPDNIMWETDFPHPTCLHPDAIPRTAEALAGLGEENLRKVLQDNAAKLYGIDIS